MSTQALEVYAKIQDPFASAMQIGEHFAKSGMFGVDRREAGTILALACITENQTPFQILRTYDIVMGKLRKKSLACFAEFRALGGKVKWLNTGDDGKEAVGEFTFEGQTLTVRFTIEDAKKQQLIKRDSAWEKTPGNMLRARVISNAIGMLAPEIVAGVVDGEPDDAPTPEPKSVLTKPAATVIEVQTVKENAPTQTASVEAQAEPAPEFLPTQSTEKFVAKTDGKTGKLTAETVNRLKAVIEDENTLELAFKWMEARGWIKPMGGLEDLSAQRAQKVLDKPQEWLEMVKTSALKGEVTK